VLPVPRRGGGTPTLLLLVFLPVALSLGLRLATLVGWPLPACGFREWTGIPCVACGGTRALLALTEGRWIEALAINPLAALAGIGAVVGGVLLLADARRGGSWFSWIQARAPRRPLRLVLAALVLNWVYLWLDGRGGP
jgi:hypothetical protein